jgi:hypothetical protein
MNRQLRLRPRALTEIERAREGYEKVGHGESFLQELETVLEAMRALPLRFPIILGAIHRALLRRYPFAVFFRIRPTTGDVVVLAVFPQRGDPAKWPQR